MPDFPAAGMTVGSHRVGRVLGAGPHGITYAAVDTRRTGTREVALKVLLPRAGLDTGMREALDAEMAALAGSGSGQVLLPREYGERGEWYVVVSTLFSAGSLQQLIDRSGPLPRPAALAVGAHVARALHDAHRAGVFHGAVKPANILPSMRDGALVPLLADFGTVQRRQAWRVPAGADLEYAQGFTAPELILPGGVADPRSDVYSLGCLLHALRTGRSPYDGPAPTHPPAIPQLPVEDEADEELNALLARALQPRPEHRSVSVVEMAERLGELATVAAAAPVLADEAAAETAILPPVRDRVTPPASAPAAPSWSGGSERAAGPPARPARGAAPAKRRRERPSGMERVGSRRVLMVVAVVAAIAAVVVVSVLHRRHQVPHSTTASTGASAGQEELRAPTVEVRPAAHAVYFVVTSPGEAEDTDLQVDRGSGWEQVDPGRVRVPTPTGERACLSARVVAGDRASKAVRACGTSRVPELAMVPVGECTIGTTTYPACYRLELSGFAPGTVKVRSAVPDTRGQVQHYTDPVEIGADGTGADPVLFGASTEQTVSVSVAGVEQEFTIGP